MYHSVVDPTLPKRVSAYIRAQELVRAGERVGVAVSGGADSVALLRLLLELKAELGLVLSLVHLNHGTRGEASDGDAAFVAQLAEQHGLELHAATADAPKFAREHRLSLEAAGRRLRYDFFGGLLAAGKLQRVATAHTADDQAETVLLRLLRGAGTRGLAGIWPQRKLPGAPASTRAGMVRPLLSVRRAELRQYLQEIGQTWREDASNLDLKHARNRVRHELLPLLEREYNPKVVEVLAATAELARAEEEFWRAKIAELLPAVADVKVRQRGGSFLDVPALLAQSLALQRRLLRAAAEHAGMQLDFHHAERVLQAARSHHSAQTTLELPRGWCVHIQGRELRFQRARLYAEPEPNPAANGYERMLPIPGEVEVRQLGLRFKAFLLPGGAGRGGYNPDQFLDRRNLAAPLTLRNWRPGDRFWPVHSKAPKKVKELLASRHIARPERALWPVAVSGTEIVWVRGFPAARSFAAAAGAEAVVIGEEPLA